MKRFRIGRLEIHEYPVEVDAKNLVEAIEKVLNGEGESVDIDNEGTYVETDEDHGITVEQLLAENPDLNKPSVLKQLLKSADRQGDFIPSIRSIEEV
jgi:hypothetical protein